jgi:hypothetical protein
MSLAAALMDSRRGFCVSQLISTRLRRFRVDTTGAALGATAMDGKLASGRQVDRHLRRRRRRRDGQRQQGAETPGDGHDCSKKKTSVLQSRAAWRSTSACWACWAWTWRRCLVKLGGRGAAASGASFGRGENKPLPRECAWRPWFGSGSGILGPFSPFLLRKDRLVPSGSRADTMTRGMQRLRG